MAGRKLRLAIVCYPTFGGSGVIAAELGQALASRGHQVHIISTDLPARLTPARGLKFHRVQVITYPLFHFPPYTLALATKIAEIMRRERLDLVQVHYAIPHSIAALLGQEMAGVQVKIITSLHGTDVQLIGHEPSYWEVTRHAMLRSDALTAVSCSLAETTVHKFRLARDIRVIPNFVNTRKFRRRHDSRQRKRIARPEEKVLLHISNFRKVKRVWEVVEIFHRLAENFPARLYLVGDGPDRIRAEQTARTLGIEERVHFLSFVDTIQEWLSVADLLLHPSEMESFGLVPLEAMSCGVPVLAYRVGGLPEVVEDGGCGYLLEVGDLRGMVERGTEILSDPSLWSALSDRGQAIARDKFSLGKVVTRYERFFREVLGK